MVAAGRADDVDAAWPVPGRAAWSSRADEVAIPGLTDAHLHLADAALERSRVELDGLRVDRGARRPGPRGGRAHGAGSRRRRRLDRRGRAGTRTPSADGPPPTTSSAPLRAGWSRSGPTTTTRCVASPAALAEAGVDERRADPAGGVIRRDATGRPTGVLHERRREPRGRAHPAARRRGRSPTRCVPLATRAARARRRRRARPGRPWCRPMASAARSRPTGRSPRPASSGLCASTPASARSSSTPPAGRGAAERVAARARTRSTGCGWAGSRRSPTARSGRARRPCSSRWSPWPGEPPPPNDGLGVWLVPPERLREQAASAAALGIATQIHGIGDAAVRAALDALAPTVGATPLVPRVEHAQLVARRRTSRGSPRSGSPRRCSPSTCARTWPRRAGCGATARTTRAYPARARSRDRRAHRVRDRRPGRADRPVAGHRLRRDARGAVLAGRDRAARAVANAISLWRAIRAACVDPAITAGEADRGRLRAGPSRGPRRAPGGGGRRSPSRSAGRCGTRARGWCSSTARSSPAADAGEPRLDRGR